MESEPNYNCEFLTGGAGTGKTYTLKERIKKDKRSIKLCATTGIAAINLSGAGKNEAITTVNSLLGYFDENSLEDNYASGRLHKALRGVSGTHRAIGIDECSMMSAITFDWIAKAIYDVNESEQVQKKGGLGLILTGDFCQLPPINGEYAFTARRWKWFEQHITKLTKIYRQTDPSFITALNAARCGDGKLCAEILADHKHVKFIDSLIGRFKGTTIFSTNAAVDKLNEVRLEKLIRDGKRTFKIKSFRWGKQRSEWKGIPDELELVEQAKVMILSNMKGEQGDLLYGNGDVGEIVGYSESSCEVGVQLNRNKEFVEIRRVTRQETVRKIEGIEPPEYITSTSAFLEYLEDKGKPTKDKAYVKQEYVLYLQDLTKKHRKGKAEIYFDFEEGKWVIGEIMYMPLRLAYGATVHKTQGLTLDCVQVDMSNKFFGNPSMAYVALSRVRKAQGLIIVGSPRLLEERINIYREILPWI